MINNFYKRFKLNQDTGFGTSATAQGDRLINADGTYNVLRKGVPFFTRVNMYHDLIKMPWWLFHLFVLAAFIMINTIYTSAYVLIGIDELQGLNATTPAGRWFEIFTFSAQTLTTVGYGRINPVGHIAAAVSAFEALTGIMFAAILTGLIFARFSRPRAKLLLSGQALIAPYKQINALMFRIVNGRKNQLIECEAQVMLSFIDKETSLRQFINLTLEIKKISGLALSWTIVHPINEQSPLWGLGEKEMRDLGMEFIFMFKGFDDTYSQDVHTRYSYSMNELVFGAKFEPMYHRSGKGTRTVLEIKKLGAYSRVPLNV